MIVLAFVRTFLSTTSNKKYKYSILVILFLMTLHSYQLDCELCTDAYIPIHMQI